MLTAGSAWRSPDSRAASGALIRAASAIVWVGWGRWLDAATAEPDRSSFNHHAARPPREPRGVFLFNGANAVQGTSTRSIV